MSDSASLYCETYPNSVITGTLWLDPEVLEQEGNGPAKNLKLYLEAYSADTYQTYLEDVCIMLYTADGLGFVQPVSEDGEVLYDKATLTLTWQGVEIREDGSILARFHICNETFSPLSLDVRELWINDILTEAADRLSVMPQSRGILYVEIPDPAVLQLNTPGNVFSVQLTYSLRDNRKHTNIIEETTVAFAP